MAMARRMLRRAFQPLLAACLALSGAAAAQSAPPLLEAYGRATVLLDFMSSYVGQSLLACAERSYLTEGQAEAHFRGWRERNAALLERADLWRRDAEQRLRAQGEDGAALERVSEAGMGATALALARVQDEMGKVRDLRALCNGKVDGIEAGRYDLSGNAEFVDLLKNQPR
jgi:hypothetical protein